MKPLQKTGKRIVSKGAYVHAQADRAGAKLAGVCFSLLSLFFGLAAVFLFACCIAELIDMYRFPSADNDLEGCLFGFALCTVIACTSYKWRQSSIDRAAKIDPGIPLTRANLADLPALDSLVRASAEPVQAQEAELLRAATGETQEEQEAELLRAVAGGQEQVT